MALFYFGSIEPKFHKKRYWFISAALVILAGFFSLGISFGPLGTTAKVRSQHRIRFAKTLNVFEINRKSLDYKIVATKPKPASKKAQSVQKRKPELKAKVRVRKQVRNKRIRKVTRQSTSAGLSHSSLVALYQKAGATFGIDWRILAAVHRVETGQAIRHFRISYAGARGPMQFLPSTFYRYAVDGDGDGQLNIYDVDDAVFTAARYLAANGGMTNIKRALFRYNHSWRYVARVLAIASTL